MTSINEIRDIRLARKNKMESWGINPYPARVTRTHEIKNLLENFDEIEKSGEIVSVAGRIMSLRGQGALNFIDLFDGTAKAQALLKKDENPICESDEELKTELSGFDIFQEIADEGDFIKVTGKLFITNRGAKTILISGWQMISKSLRPIPDEFYGIKDEDERYRQRYLDILLNDESRKIVEQKSKFWNAFRQYLLKRDFVEVQTPVLENTAGGAEAKPFVTHHNALDIDVFLRISCGELWQKQLMVAGLPKTFEIGRIFRNEGMSATHLQDYTQIEFYEAFRDFEYGMEMIKDLYRFVATETFGTTVFNINDQEVDLSKDWQTYDLVETLKNKFGVNVLETELEKLIELLKENKITFNPKEINKERATDLLWKVCRKEIVGPGFLINVPVFMEPLAKKTKSGQTVERFQIILGGTELGKGFSELNDPIDQESRFDHQESLRQAGDDEAQMKDSEYVEAMEYGMPPVFGFGISERLYSVLAGKPIRETTIFPMMRPRE